MCVLFLNFFVCFASFACSLPVDFFLPKPVISSNLFCLSLSIIRRFFCFFFAYKDLSQQEENCIKGQASEPDYLHHLASGHTSAHKQYDEAKCMHARLSFCLCEPCRGTSTGQKGWDQCARTGSHKTSGRNNTENVCKKRKIKIDFFLLRNRNRPSASVD